MSEGSGSVAHSINAGPGRERKPTMGIRVLKDGTEIAGPSTVLYEPPPEEVKLPDLEGLPGVDAVSAPELSTETLPAVDNSNPLHVFLPTEMEQSDYLLSLCFIELLRAELDPPEGITTAILVSPTQAAGMLTITPVGNRARIVQVNAEEWTTFITYQVDQLLGRLSPPKGFCSPDAVRLNPSFSALYAIMQSLG